MVSVDVEKEDAWKQPAPLQLKAHPDSISSDTAQRGEPEVQGRHPSCLGASGRWPHSTAVRSLLGLVHTGQSVAWGGGS